MTLTIRTDSTVRYRGIGVTRTALLPAARGTRCRATLAVVCALLDAIVSAAASYGLFELGMVLTEEPDTTLNQYWAPLLLPKAQQGALQLPPEPRARSSEAPRAWGHHSGPRRRAERRRPAGRSGHASARQHA